MNVIWTKKSDICLHQIHDYIVKDSVYYANNFIQQIVKVATHLEKNPRLGRPVPEAESENYREILFKGYRIIYYIENETVFILAVIHGSRDLTREKNQPWNKE